jgi:hypothetical protein
VAITVDKASIAAASTADAAAGTHVLTTNQTIAAGTLIVVSASWLGSNTVTGVADNSGNGYGAWSIDKQGNVGLSEIVIASVYATSGLASGTNITFTFSDADASGRSAGGSSFLGVKSTSYVDGTPLGPTGVATQAWDSGNATLAAGSVLYGACNTFDVAGSHAATTGTEAWESLDVADLYGSAAIYRIGTSAGSYNVAGSWSGAGNNTNIAVAYLAATGSASASVSPSRSASASATPSASVSASPSSSISASASPSSAPPAFIERTVIDFLVE